MANTDKFGSRAPAGNTPASSGLGRRRLLAAAWAARSELRATALAVSPENPAQIVAATSRGLTQSRDGGITWTAFAAA